jgi:hypothetical protein
VFDIQFLVGGLEHGWIIFHFIYGIIHPSHWWIFFQRGRSTANQILLGCLEACLRVHVQVPSPGPNLLIWQRCKSIGSTSTTRQATWDAQPLRERPGWNGDFSSILFTLW